MQEPERTIAPSTELISRLAILTRTKPGTSADWAEDRWHSPFSEHSHPLVRYGVIRVIFDPWSPAPAISPFCPKVNA